MSDDTRLGRRLVAATRFERWEQRIASATNRALSRQEDAALGRLSTMVGSVPFDPFDEASWDEAVADEIVPTVESIMEEIARLALSVVPDGVEPPLVDLAQHAAALVARIRGVGLEVAANLTSSLTEGSLLGEGIDALRDRVLDLFTSSESRARTIARTTVVGSANGATHEAYETVQETIGPLLKEWIATSDERTRETHWDADGQTVEYAEPFEVGDDLLDYPGDPSGSAAEIINCRCAVAYHEAENAGDDSAE